MSSIDNSAGADAPARMAPVPPPPHQRPWGVWASLAFYVLFFEVEPYAYDFVLNTTGLQAVLDRSRLLLTLDLFVAHGIRLLLFVLVVRLTAIPVRDYLGWTRPRVGDVVLGIAAIAALYGAFGLLVALTGNAGGAVSDYRAALAAGTSPWWYVLQWWPAIFLAPIVEESVYRGFLWRGIQFRLGNWAAFLITTLVFVAAHYQYWAPGGVVDPVSVVQYLVTTSIFGWLRWRSGGTVAPTIAHMLDNAGLKIAVVVLSAFAP